MRFSSPLVTALGCFLAGAILAGVCNWRVLVGSMATQATDADSLEFDHVQLGTLVPNQKKPFFIKLRNRHTAVLELSAPSTSCGCIAAAKEPISLQPGAQISVPFIYHADSYPGSVNRNVVFACAADSTLTWTVNVAGEVVANVWAEPSEILIVYEDGEIPRGEFLLHRRFVPEETDAPLFDVVAGDPALVVEPTQSSAEMQRFSVSISGEAASGEGAVSLRILGKDRSTVLMLPVQWKRKPLLRCYPPALRLKTSRVADSHESRRLVISRGAEIQGRAIDIQALVPWLRVAKTQDSGGAVVVDLRLDPDTIPENFDAPALRISASGREPVLYRAQIGRPIDAR